MATQDKNRKAAKEKELKKKNSSGSFDFTTPTSGYKDKHENSQTEIQEEEHTKKGSPENEKR